MVVATNTKGGYGEPSLPGYYTKISQAFIKFLSLVGPTKTYKPKITFDGANGVGAPAMKEFNKMLADVLAVEIVNAGEGELNYGCGADYVKTTQAAPVGQALSVGQRWVSVDGDADRIVYYFASEKVWLL